MMSKDCLSIIALPILAFVLVKKNELCCFFFYICVVHLGCDSDSG